MPPPPPPQKKNPKNVGTKHFVIGGEGDLRQRKHLPQNPFTGQFFGYRQLALHSISLIFLRYKRTNSHYQGREHRQLVLMIISLLPGATIFKYMRIF
jgi:hypothetical protein